MASVKPSVAFVVAVVVSALIPIRSAPAAVGDLTQKPGALGCVQESGSFDCADGVGLNGATHPLMSPDGRNVYVLTNNSTLLIFDRDPTTGNITQKAGQDGCIRHGGSTATCTGAAALQAPTDFALSPDGRNLYVVSVGSGSLLSQPAIAIFYRDLDSGVLQAPSGTDACISEDGSSGLCRDGHSLTNPTGVAVSPDGYSVYVSANSAVLIFRRDLFLGGISQVLGPTGCYGSDVSGCTEVPFLQGATDVAVAPDGRSVYVTSYGADAVSVFDRNPAESATLTRKAGLDGCVQDAASGQCADGRAISSPQAVFVSPSGRNVYVLATNALATFDRDTGTGGLTQKSGTAGCINPSGNDGCAASNFMAAPLGIAFARDGARVYVSTLDTLLSLDRDLASGTLALPPGQKCVSETGSLGACVDGRAVSSMSGVAISPDDGNVYVTSTGSDAIAVFDRERLDCQLSQLLGASRCFTFENGHPLCTESATLGEARAAAVSPDGLNVYVASFRHPSSLLIFDRNPLSGILTQKAAPDGCISNSEALSGICMPAIGMASPTDVAVSADGRNVYVAAGRLLVFDREPTTGRLTQKPGIDGCVGVVGDPCQTVQRASGLTAVVVSRDGRDVYASSFAGDAVVILQRNRATGALSAGGVAGCVGPGIECTDAPAIDGPQGLAIDSMGHHLYVAAFHSDALVTLTRRFDGDLQRIDGTAGCVSDNGGDCVDGVALNGVTDVVVSEDGRNVYATSQTNSAVPVLDRNPITGILTQKGGSEACISESGSSGTCSDGKGLLAAQSVAVRPDDGSLYVGASSRMAVLTRDRSTGVLTQSMSPEACLRGHNLGPDCIEVPSLLGDLDATISPDGRSVYVASAFALTTLVCTRCGDGVLTQSEQCDDGNLVDDDGCSATCELESTLSHTAPAARPGGIACLAASLAGSAAPAALHDEVAYDGDVFSHLGAAINPSIGAGSAADKQLAAWNTNDRAGFSIAGGAAPIPIGLLFSASFQVDAVAPGSYDLAGVPVVLTICTGDCDGNGALSLGEVTRCVNHFLGQPLCSAANPLSSCPVVDANLDGSVSIGEVQQCLNRFLGGCITATPTPTGAPGTPTPTPTPTTD